MRTRKRLFYLPIISAISLISLIYLVISLPPSYPALFLNFNFTILPLFFLLLLLFIWSLSWFIFANKIQGFITGLFAILYLFLRLNKLTEPFFLILLIILYVSIQLFFFRKK